MTTRKGLLLFALLFVLALWMALPALAQEVTLEPDVEQPPPVELEAIPAGDVTIEADDPFGPEEAFAAIIALGGSVAAAMEFLKRVVVRPIVGEDTTTPRYALTSQALAFGLSLVTIFALNDPRANVLAALGIFPTAPLWFAQGVTALAVSFGNQLLHALRDYFAAARRTAAVVEDAPRTWDPQARR